MTAKHEAELETENRMLREQVETLKTVIEQISRPAVHRDSTPSTLPGTTAYPWWVQTYPFTVSAGGLSSAVSGLSSVTLS